jgi:vacuolar-type H+-ATPase subunit F/Vma7
VSRAVAIGERELLIGYALAGVEIIPADGPEPVREAWARLDEGVALVILTPSARTALGRRVDERPECLWAVTPP